MSKKERPPYLTYKRRSRLEESFWYPNLGTFLTDGDFFYSLVEKLRPKCKGLEASFYVVCSRREDITI